MGLGSLKSAYKMGRSSTKPTVQGSFAKGINPGIYGKGGGTAYKVGSKVTKQNALKGAVIGGAAYEGSKFIKQRRSQHQGIATKRGSNMNKPFGNR